ncbi:hypothetical protein [Runella limosa]|uniref:hypothetical protein n=1 Tax=Runella limosa TaxID=370978 RepID=UPI0006844E9E|nr:hypothetical protein [Runella limosa]
MNNYLKQIPYSIAQYIMYALIGFGLAFQLCVIIGLIPHKYVWGGRLENQEQMVVFELISMSNLLLLFILIQVHGRTKYTNLKKVATVLLWVFAGIFALNTLGNLFAISSLETLLFTPITVVASIMCGRIALGK